MATAEELLMSLDDSVEVYTENDEIFVIDSEGRTINVPDGESLFGVSGDKDVERKYFQCPKIVGDNIDLSQHQIYISYVFTQTQNDTIFPSVGNGLYYCDDVEVSGDNITFSWLLSGNVLSNPGFIAFKVMAKKSEGSELKTKWNTAPAFGTVLITVPDGEEIAEEYPDVINQIFDRLDALESGGGGGTGGTTNYEKLSNKPQLNGVTLEGNKTLDQVGALAKNQGSSNSGKYLSVGSDGNVALVDAPSGGGGTGGTTDYNDLTNRPKLNGVTLEGNKTLDQIGAVQKNQGSGNSGKYLSVGSDGNVTLSDAPEGSVKIDTTLTKTGEAADAKIVGDELDKKINKSGWSSNKFLGTNESGNIIEKDAPEGESIPNGGTTGQVLTKKSNSDKDVGWGDPTAIINKASESNLGGVKVKNATEEQTVFVGIDNNGFLKVNESGTPSDYNTVKNNSEKIALDKTDTYSIADNRDEIFNSIETSKSEHLTITDGSDYWDADEAALYPSVLSMEQIRKNRFYANMWLPNGLEIEQDYRYADNKNGHIRLYDIKTQKTDLIGIGPWGICLRSEGKNFPTSEINFIISAFRILGLNSETGKWELIKKQRPIAAIYDIEKTSTEGTYLQVEREDLGNDMYQFPVRKASNWIINGSEMCFHFYNQLEDAISSDDLEPYSKIIVTFRMRVKEEEYSNVFTCSAGCDAYGSSSSVEAFFSRFNAVTNRLLEYNATNCLEKEAMLISDNLLYIDELLSDENDFNSGGELTPEPTPVQESTPYDGKTIIAFGDSIVAGWGWKEGTGVVKPLQEKYTKGTWINKAVSGTNMAELSSGDRDSILKTVKDYTGAADYILLEGGTNDVNNAISIGSISSGYDDTFDENTFTGALESALQTIMNRWPLARKFFLIPHSFAKDNSYVDSVHNRAKEVCEKWNMPVLDMRNMSQIAMTSQNKNTYTRNPNTKQGDGVHPTEVWYRAFYSPIIDQFMRSLGEYSGDVVPPETVPVTSVTLDKRSLSLSIGDKIKLNPTVLPSNASNKSVTWKSEKSEIASVVNGLVTGVGQGNTTITVKTVDGEHTDTCDVNVTQESTAEEHQELEKITVDKSCYFDTGIVPNDDTRFNLKVHPKHTQISGSWFFGVRSALSKYTLSVTDNWYCTRGSIESAPGRSKCWLDICTVSQKSEAPNTFTFNGTDVSINDASGMDFNNHTAYICNVNNNGQPYTDAGFGGDLYFCQIFDGSNLIADFVPVKKTDGTLCLYDKIKHTYLYNLGTGKIAE